MGRINSYDKILFDDIEVYKIGNEDPATESDIKMITEKINTEPITVRLLDINTGYTYIRDIRDIIEYKICSNGIKTTFTVKFKNDNIHNIETDELSHYKMEAALISNSYNELLKENKQLQKENTTLKEEKTIIRNNHDTLYEKYQNLYMAHNDLKKENNEYKEKYSNAIIDCNALIKHNAYCVEECKCWAKDYNALMKNNVNQEQKISDLRAHIDSLNHRCDNCARYAYARDCYAQLQADNGE